MGHRFTREQLYDLVWTRPRTALAKAWGVSDVAIGKACRKASIPVPGLGYWARQAQGRAPSRPPLPLRLPGHPRYLRLGDNGNHQEIDWRERECLFEVIEPDVFEEDIEAQVAAALALVGPVRHRRDPALAHPALARLLKEEDERRELAAAKEWHWKKPRFEAPVHQRQLRIFHSLAHALAPVLRGCEVQVREEHPQGAGAHHDLYLHLGADPSWRMTLRFLEPGDQRVAKHRRVQATTLEIESHREANTTLQWSDTPDAKLERQLPQIVRAVFLEAEARLRRAAQHDFEHRLDYRQRQLDAIAQRHRAAEAQVQAQQAAQRQRLLDGIRQLAQDARQAEDIRALVARLQARPDCPEEVQPQWAQWRRDALALADSLDPARRPWHDLLALTGPPADPTGPES